MLNKRMVRNFVDYWINDATFSILVCHGLVLIFWLAVFTYLLDSGYHFDFLLR